MTIHKLIDGIVTKWVATSALTSAFAVNAAGPFRERAPEGTARPYTVLEIPSGQAPLTDAYGNAISAETVVIFKVVANGHDAAAALMSTLLGVFDHTTLTLTGATNIGMYRVGEPVPTELERDTAVAVPADVWQWAVAYAYQTQ